MSTDRSATRSFAIASALTGIGTLVGAERIATTTGHRGAVPDPRIVRVLGARQVVQALVTYVRPTPTVLTLGAAVDASHAASMVALAAASGRFRRPALTSAAVASVSVALAAALATRSAR